MNLGDVVRPVVTIAGLDSRCMYRVIGVERAPFGYTLAFLVDAAGASMPPVENAHLVLEVVKASTIKPSTAAWN